MTSASSNVGPRKCRGWCLPASSTFHAQGIVREGVPRDRTASRRLRTHDEGFEALTLIHTGKSEILRGGTRPENRTPRLCAGTRWRRVSQRRALQHISADFTRFSSSLRIDDGDPSDLVRIRALSRRIESESEPPNLATETNTDRGVFEARTPQSPVRIREGSSANTPRNRGDFSACTRLRAVSLRPRRPNGGGASPGGTCLGSEIPDMQGKYREITRIRASRRDASPACGLLWGC
jgi:hypothetical protein